MHLGVEFRPKLFALADAFLNHVARGHNQFYVLLRHHAPEVGDGVWLGPLARNELVVLAERALHRNSNVKVATKDVHLHNRR